ncbi:MAG: FAD binding domain-containing protein, partial [Anaerolineales bacterium]
MWKKYFQPNTLDQALEILAEKQGSARIISGGTDLILEIEAGLRTGVTDLIDITRIPGLDMIELDEEGHIRLGALVTHNMVAASKLVVEQGLPLAQASWEVGAPQIRNRGTVAGNLITASPANDTITPLVALNAKVRLQSVTGSREVPLSEFITGVRRNQLQPDEMLVEIIFPAMQKNQRGMFYKVGLRKAQAISVLNLAAVLNFEGDTVSLAAITLGAVAPTIIHAGEAEAFLTGKKLTPEVIEQAAQLAVSAAKPIDDIRGTAAYRRYMVGVIARRTLTRLAEGSQAERYPVQPPMLSSMQGVSSLASPVAFNGHKQPIETVINGKAYSFTSGHEKTLLDLLREDALLTGTKEGCAEGECG